MRFRILDVFAKRRYEGNQLAVFIAPEDLSSDEMQRMAREINFSESSFILGVDDSTNEARVRIFTPRAEVDFAGHPVIGTAYVLQELAGAERGGITLDLKVGKVQVTYSVDALAPYWVQTVEPKSGQTLPASRMATVLGLAEGDFVRDLPIESVSTGLPSFIVPLTGRKALAACDLNLAAYRELVKETSVSNILMFSEEPYEKGQDFSVRVFAEALGVPEDPATGSANGCLAAYLMQHMKRDQNECAFRVGQGYEMGRPSELHLKVQRHPAGYHVHLGGNVVEVASGDWRGM